MAFDLIIEGGRIVDGTGAPERNGDIGIKDGVIQEMGALGASQAKQRLNADGALVTPGFVDIHTHYDGQISWDKSLFPSSCHGVTTVVMGNCGVGFAPVRDGDEKRLIELMEGVEEIPGGALSEGMTWNWHSFGDYLGAIDSDGHAIDYAAQLAHDPLRFYVMGERAIAGEEATPDDLRAMRQLTCQAIMEGAVGVSTGRTNVHRTAKGEETPARYANRRELEALAHGLRDAGRGVVQLVSDFRLEEGDDYFEEEFDLVDAMAAAAGRPLSLSLLQRDVSPRQWGRILSRVEAANARGQAMHVQVAARGIGVYLGLETTLNPLMVFPGYQAIATRPLDERVAIMRDPAFKASMLAQERVRLSGGTSSIPPLADIVMDRLDFFALRFFRLGDDLNYEPEMAQSIYYEARARDVSVMEAIYDILLEEQGHQLIYFPIYNYSRFNLDDLRTMITHPHALLGLSDGGAHVGTVCDASFPTFMLTHWVRDRSRGEKLPLEKVVHMQTQANAAYMGFYDRGVLAPGMKADINVIDLGGLRLTQPYMVRDLPAGGARLVQEAQGMIATYVSGQAILSEDRLTGAHPGRLVRPTL